MAAILRLTLQDTLIEAYENVDDAIDKIQAEEIKAGKDAKKKHVRSRIMDNLRLQTSRAFNSQFIYLNKDIIININNHQ